MPSRRRPPPDEPPVRRPPVLAPALSTIRSPDEVAAADDWDGLHLAGLDLTGWDADLHLTGCRLRGVRLIGADVNEFNAADCVFEECDLSALCAQSAAISRCEFHRCRMDGIALSGATLRHVALIDCKATDANFRFGVGESVELVGCDLANADLTSVRWPAAVLRTCGLEGVQLRGAHLEGAVLHGSRLEGLQSVEALRGAHLLADQLLPLARSLALEAGIVIDPLPED